jgi:hypothetical protein
VLISYIAEVGTDNGFLEAGNGMCLKLIPRHVATGIPTRTTKDSLLETSNHLAFESRGALIGSLFLVIVTGEFDNSGM